MHFQVRQLFPADVGCNCGVQLAAQGGPIGKEPQPSRVSSSDSSEASLRRASFVEPERATSAELAAASDAEEHDPGELPHPQQALHPQQAQPPPASARDTATAAAQHQQPSDGSQAAFTCSRMANGDAQAAITAAHDSSSDRPSGNGSKRLHDHSRRGSQFNEAFRDWSTIWSNIGVRGESGGVNGELPRKRKQKKAQKGSCVGRCLTCGARKPNASD